MFLDHNDAAEQNDTLIISACAFDSVPADLGCLFTQRLFSEGRCSSIESFLQVCALHCRCLLYYFYCCYCLCYCYYYYCYYYYHYCYY